MPIGPKGRVLLIGGDATEARNLSAQLTRRGFDIQNPSSSDDALRLSRSMGKGVALLDLTGLLQGQAGISTLERLRQLRPEMPVIVLVSPEVPEMAFKASKAGAEDFLNKPFDLNEAETRIQRLLERQEPPPKRTDLTQRHPDLSMLFGTSPKMEDVKLTIEKVADTNATVLIRGESGTGKEMVARLTYSQSGRRDKPFVKVNCAAIPYELLESELFGYEQGAFTGASRQKLGKFDQANGGTLFLDEISEMHPALQAKLLHVLQDGEFARLGGKRDIAVDVRVLAASNKPLELAVAQGSFREDLFYRLNVVTIHIPPLRERREEIPVFLDFFVQKYSEFYNKKPAPFSEAALAKMMEYSWPGNIRELENLVKRYTIVGNEGQILRELDTHKPIVSSSSAAPANDPNRLAEYGPAPVASMPAPVGSVEAKTLSWEESPSLLEIGRRAAMLAEREAIERVMLQTKWNRRQAAKILKVSYKALLNKLKLIEEQTQSKSEKTTA